MATTERRATIIRLTVASIVLVGGYLGLCAWSAQHLPANLAVGGIQIGGMTPAQAEAAIVKGARAPLTSPITLTIPDSDDTVEVVPEQAGLSVDARGSVEGLTGFTLNPVTVWSKLTGATEAPLLTTVDDEALTAALTKLAPSVAVKPTEGGITFPKGKVTVTAPVPGRSLAVPETKLALRAAFPTATIATAVVTPVPPRVSPEAIATARTTFADKAMSGPVTVVTPGAKAVIPPADFAPAVTMVPDGKGGLQPKFDNAKLIAVVAAKAKVATRAARDAQWTFVDGRPKLVPSVTGRAVDESVIPARMIAAMTSPTRQATIEAAVTQPKFTTAEAQKAGVKEAVVYFKSPFPSGDVTRTNNLIVAARKINGTYLPPGGTFSLNGILGERTTAKGYQDGTVIINGRLTRGTGGGISQVSTVIYNLAYFAGARTLEFTPHAFFIPRYPEGREATVYWPSVDNKWKNDTPYGMLLQTWVADGHVHGRVWSTKYWDIRSVKGERRNVVPPKDIKDDSLTCYPQEPNPGFDVTVTRQWYRPGSSVLVKSEVVNTHYIPEDRITCTNPNARP